MIRTPDHMTRTKGGAHIVRTYNARHRVSFTKLAVTCCAEQLCEGRMFCLEEVNDSLSERVREWKRLKGDDRMMSVERHDDESSWRLFTNSPGVRDAFKKCWLNQREWRDPRGFVKDVAEGVMRDKQAVNEVHVAHCVYAVEDLRRESGGDESWTSSSASSPLADAATADCPAGQHEKRSKGRKKKRRKRKRKENTRDEKERNDSRVKGPKSLTKACGSWGGSWLG